MVALIKTTIRSCLVDAKSSLENAGIEEPLKCARLLLSYVLERPLEFLIGHPEFEISEKICRDYKAVIHRRALGEPPSKIVGHREFWSRQFYVDVHVLDPRPDSETLIEAVEVFFPTLKSPQTILELGVGSGCLLLTLLLNHPTLIGFGVDKSINALQCAVRNVHHHQLENRAHLIQGDWCSALQGTFDIIVSNPPYIPSGDIRNLSPELSYDPLLALDGGGDGLSCYHLLSQQLQSLVHQDTLIFFEIGMGQHGDVQKLMSQQGFKCHQWFKDLSGLERIGVFQLK